MFKSFIHRLLFLGLPLISIIITGCSSSGENIRPYQSLEVDETQESPEPPDNQIISRPASTEDLLLAKESPLDQGPNIEGPNNTPIFSSTASSSHLLVTPSATFIPTKKLIVVYGFQEGDAGGDHFVELSTFRYEPILVIYSDGQVLIKQDKMIFEDWISEAELCTLYSRLRDAIESSELASRYNASPTPNYCISGCGAPSMTLRISGGERYFAHSASILEGEYLSRAASLPFEIIDEFLKVDTVEQFISDRVLVWFERIQRENAPSLADDFPVYLPEYPYSFGAIEPFIGDSDRGFALFEGQDATDMYMKFQNLPSIGLHRENERDYVIIIRPLLPHEDWDDFLAYLSVPYPSTAERIGLSCIQ